MCSRSTTPATLCNGVLAVLWQIEGWLSLCPSYHTNLKAQLHRQLLHI
jgi:hypothetical protein